LLENLEIPIEFLHMRDYNKRRYMRFSTQRNKVLILVIVVLLIFSLNFFSKEVRNFFYSVSRPVQNIFWRTGDRISDFFEGIFGRENLKKENEELKSENQKLLAENVTLEEIKTENQTLRKALKIGLEKEFQLDFAEVAGKYIDQDSILINKGSKNGLFENMPVITEDKVLVGKIVEVHRDFSRVALISNKESFFDVQISGKGIDGLVRGKGSSEVYLDLIPRDKEIREGDLVVSSSLGGKYPEGLLVGVVKEIKKSDIQPFQQAEISPFLDLQELKNVFVILNF
jgi:rod shape-determining protein MreC